MSVKQKSADRLAVLQRIEEYEKKGLFVLDAEINPPWQPVNTSKLDCLNKKLSSKVKTRIANFMGKRYFMSQLKKKAVIFEGVKGLENLKDFKGGAMVTCNHCHQFDNFAVYLGLKNYFTKRSFKLYKIVREGNYSFPGIVGFFMRHCNTLPVNERENANFKLTSKTVKAVNVLLKRGEKILIYAEQGMWWNYRKPRPLRKGAFLFAAKSESPIIPCFLTMQDSDIIGADGFPVQKFTCNILPVIYPDKNLSAAENSEIMMAKNFELWKNQYEETYGIPLSYTTDESVEIDAEDD